MDTRRATGKPFEIRIPAVAEIKSLPSYLDQFLRIGCYRDRCARGEKHPPASEEGYRQIHSLQYFDLDTQREQVQLRNELILIPARLWRLLFQEGWDPTASLPLTPGDLWGL
jgi:hypothetical protein